MSLRPESASDLLIDGKLTPGSGGVFDVVDPAKPLSGPVKRLSFVNEDDVEAICFADEETLIIGAEAAGRIFEVPLAVFVDYPRN